MERHAFRFDTGDDSLYYRWEKVRRNIIRINARAKIKTRPVITRYATVQVLVAQWEDGDSIILPIWLHSNTIQPVEIVTGRDGHRYARYESKSTLPPISFDWTEEAENGFAYCVIDSQLQGRLVGKVRWHGELFDASITTSTYIRVGRFFNLAEAKVAVEERIKKLVAYY